MLAGWLPPAVVDGSGEVVARSAAGVDGSSVVSSAVAPAVLEVVRALAAAVVVVVVVVATPVRVAVGAGLEVSAVGVAELCAVVVVAVGADMDADGGSHVGVVAGASVLEPRDGTSLVEAGAVSFGAPVDVDVSTPGRVDVGVVDGWDGPLVLIDAIVSSTNVVAVGWVGMMPTEAVDDRPVGAASLVVGMRMEDMICAEDVVDEATVVLTVTVVVVDVFVLDVSATTSSS